MIFPIRIAALLSLCTFFSCRENQPEYTLSRAEIGDRNVVVEEFSGVRCPNCPEGTKELENLRDIYNGKVIIVTIHAGDFAFSYPDSQYDFTTPEGNALLKLLGNPIGYPSAVINRVRDNNAQSLQSFSSKWGSIISRELAKDPLVTLDLEINFDPDSKRMSIVMSAIPTEDLLGDFRFTLLIKENNMVDWQSDSEASQGVDQNYNHRNVLRSILSNAQGDAITNRAIAFERIEKTYSFTLPEQSNWWKPQDLWLVAFVTGGSGEILQGIEKPLLP